MNGYLVFYYKDGSAVLCHHGVKKMQWGKWNEETRKRRMREQGLRNEIKKFEDSEEKTAPTAVIEKSLSKHLKESGNGVLRNMLGYEEFESLTKEENKKFHADYQNYLKTKVIPELLEAGTSASMKKKRKKDSDYDIATKKLGLAISNDLQSKGYTRYQIPDKKTGYIPEDSYSVYGDNQHYKKYNTASLEGKASKKETAGRNMKIATPTDIRREHTATGKSIYASMHKTFSRPFRTKDAVETLNLGRTIFISPNKNEVRGFKNDTALNDGKELYKRLKKAGYTHYVNPIYNRYLDGPVDYKIEPLRKKIKTKYEDIFR